MKPLEAVLDFILNQASDAEFEVVVKACERRRKDNRLFSKLGGMNPGKMAKNLSSEINESMGASLDGLRTMVKGYVAEIIRKNAPEITESQLGELLEEYVPSPGAPKKAEASSLPPEMLLDMAKDFIKYSTGSMSPLEQKRLWDEMPRWQDHYWERFPSEIKTLIDAFLRGRIDEETCFSAIMSILGL